ncbi:hypothetical protein K7432_004068 [Basidiobolus ranarum]|uniref:Uncharacterized protein n=1 Tax=Basidiobolus ranarum TaxID=34480 RepID=A0ABR2WYR5_9FUNG
MEYEGKASPNNRSHKTDTYDVATKDRSEHMEHEALKACNRKSRKGVTEKQSKGRNLKFWSACDALYC